MTAFTMKSYKYDQKLHYEQTLSFYERGEDYIALKGAKGRTLHHYTRKATYTFDKETIEYFFSKEWYTIAFVFNKEGICDYIYCNICLPSTIKEQEVSFVDLDLDVIYENGQVKIVDQDEFDQHKVTYKYPDEVIKKAEESALFLCKAIEKKIYPFNLYI